MNVMQHQRKNLKLGTLLLIEDIPKSFLVDPFLFLILSPYTSRILCRIQISWPSDEIRYSPEGIANGEFSHYTLFNSEV